MKYSQLTKLGMAITALVCAGAANAAIEERSGGIKVYESLRADKSPPLTDLIRIVQERRAQNPDDVKPADYVYPNITELPNGPVVMDRTLIEGDAPLRQTQQFGNPQAPAIDQSLDGIGQDDAPGGGLPPDTNGDIGPDNYIMYINTDWQIYDKDTGQPTTGVMEGNTFWAGFGGVCETSNSGDPIVIYDKLADRWMFSQFTGITGVFAGLALGSALAGWAGMYWIRSMLRSPDWQPMEEGASLCDKDAVHAVVEAAPTAYREPLIKLVRTMAGLDHVALRKHQGEAIGFFADERQLGHLHATGYVDLPLPVELGDVLLAEGHVTPHRMHDGCGWYTYRVQAPVDGARAEGLLRVAHGLYEMVREGEEGPHVHAERPGLHLTPASEAAMRQAARRVLNQAASRAP